MNLSPLELLLLPFPFYAVVAVWAIMKVNREKRQGKAPPAGRFVKVTRTGFRVRGRAEATIRDGEV